MEDSMHDQTTGLDVPQHSNVIRNLLRKSHITSQFNSRVQRIEFNNHNDAKSFSTELLKVGFGNRNQPDQPKKIEAIIAGPNDNDGDRYAVELTMDEWSALGQDEHLFYRKEQPASVTHISQKAEKYAKEDESSAPDSGKPETSRSQKNIDTHPESKFTIPVEFQTKIISFLNKLASEKPDIKDICEKLIKATEECSSMESFRSIISHLIAVKHDLKIKEGKSAYYEESSTDFLELIQEAKSILGNLESTKENPLLEKGNTIPRPDNFNREQQCRDEQLSYDENQLFHKFLQEIRLYAIENGYVSKTVFVSYAWPIGNEDNEAWTKPFVEKLVEHLIAAGFSVYLDEKHSGAGFPLDIFMEKIGKVDHVLVISSRTMGKKLEKLDSGVSQENNKIKKYIGGNKLLVKERAIIPVLLNYQNHCYSEYRKLAEVPICVDGYLKSLRALIQRMYGSGDNFVKWFDNKLREEKMAGMFNLPSLRPSIIKRENNIDQLFKKNYQTGRSSFVICYGEKGVGKAKLALQFCHDEYLKQYNYIFWFDAKNIKELQEVYSATVKALLGNQYQKESEKDDFELWIQKNTNCLFIFAHAENHDQIKYFLPNTQGDVLITTMDAEEWPNHPKIEVLRFTEKESFEYIKKRLGERVIDKQEYIEELAKLFQNHPRAMSRACKYIKKNQLSIPRFLEMCLRKPIPENILAIFNLINLNPAEIKLSLDPNEEIKKLQLEEHIDIRPKTESSVGSTIPLNQRNFRQVPAYNPNFTGRKKLLQGLKNFLPNPILGNNKPVVITACHGLGGVGKTQLAIEYAYQNSQHYKLTWWIPAGNKDQVQLAYHDLAKHLKLIADEEKVLPEEVTRRVKYYLVRNAGNLLIFDNVEDYDSLKEFIPETGNSVLITSRSQDASKWLNNQIAVDVFDIDESREYIQKVLGERNLNDVDLLANILGRLPLALAQATAYIKQSKISIQEYLNIYQQRKEVLLAEELPTWENHEAVYVTWNITMEKIQKESPLAIELISACSYLHHQGIPTFLLKSFSQKSEKPTKEVPEEAFGVLSFYSLLTIEPGLETVSLHSLVQQIIQLKLVTKEKEENLILFKHVLEELYPKDADKMENYAVMQILIPHIEALLKVLDNLVETLNENKDDEEIEKNRIVSKAKNELFLKDPLLKLLTLLGEGHLDLGNFVQAKLFLERLLKIKESFYSPDHVEVARTLIYLGNAYGDSGDVQKQKKCSERALEIFISISDPNHLEVAVALENLGNAYGKLGDAQKQKTYYEWALKIEEFYYGPDHVEVARTLLNLGSAYGALGDFQKQRTYYERALKIQKPYYEPNHVKVAKTLLNLGGAYGNLGDVQNQKTHYESALKIFESHYTLAHVEVAIALQNLGAVHDSLGEVQQAIIYLERALKIFEFCYDPNHVQVATTLNNLGNAYGNSGDIQKKKTYLERALKIFESHYGPAHIEVAEVAKVLSNLGNIYGHLGDVQKKKTHLERALKIFESCYAPNHLEVARTLDDLAAASGHLGDVQQVIIYLEQALKIREIYYDPNHVEVASTLVNLGAAYRFLGIVQQATIHLERALKIFESCHGPDHPSTQFAMQLLNKTSNELAMQSDEQQAIINLETALKIFESCYGSDHPFTQFTEKLYTNFDKLQSTNNVSTLSSSLLLKSRKLSNQGMRLYQSKEHIEALRFFQQALLFLQQTGAINSEEGATLYFNIGAIYLLQKKYQDAKPRLEKSLELRLTLFGQNHPATQKSLARLEECKKMLNYH